MVCLSNRRAERSPASEFVWSLHFFFFSWHCPACYSHMGGEKIWEWGMRHPKQHTELHLWADTPTPPESAAETQGAAGDLQQVLKGQDRVGKKGLFQYFGYKSNYPIIVLCELASPPQMGLLCNSCWVQKALNILLCPVMSHQSISRAVHPSSPWMSPDSCWHRGVILPLYL